jgi:hypothetical protein
MKSQPTVTSTFASRTSPSTDQSLQKSLQLSSPDKIELKKISSPSENKKYPTAQPNTTKTEKRSIDNGLQGRTTRTTGYNTRLAQWGLTSFIETLCFYCKFVLVDNLVFQNPPLRQAWER